MKKYNNPIPDGGAPLHNNRLNTELQAEFWNVMEAQLSQYNADTEGLIISGCVVSGAGPYDISAGIVYLNGEFMRFPGATGVTMPSYIAAAAPVNINKTFADGASKTLIVDKAAERLGAAPGGVQYITMGAGGSTNDRYFKNIGKVKSIDNGTDGVLGTTISYRTVKRLIVVIGPWDMYVSGAGPNKGNEYVLKHGIPNLRSRLLSLQIRINSDIGFTSSFYSTGTSPDDDVDGKWYIDNTDEANNQITLRTGTGLSYDTASYDDFTINRGIAIIEYLE